MNGWELDKDLDGYITVSVDESTGVTHAGVMYKAMKPEGFPGANIPLSGKWKLEAMGDGSWSVTIDPADGYWDHKGVFDYSDAVIFAYQEDGTLCECVQIAMEAADEKASLKCWSIEEKFETWETAGF
jgi:hypothetical protein